MLQSRSAKEHDKCDSVLLRREFVKIDVHRVVTLMELRIWTLGNVLKRKRLGHRYADGSITYVRTYVRTHTHITYIHT